MKKISPLPGPADSIPPTPPTAPTASTPTSPSNPLIPPTPPTASTPTSSSDPPDPQNFSKIDWVKELVSEHTPGPVKTFGKNTGDYIQNNPAPVIAGGGASTAATYKLVTDRKDANVANSIASMSTPEIIGKAVNNTGNFESGLEMLHTQNASPLAFEQFAREANIPIGAMEFK